MKQILIAMLLLTIVFPAKVGLSQQKFKVEPDSKIQIDSTESVLPDSPRTSSTAESGKVAWQAILSGGSLSASAGLKSRDALGQIAVGAATTQDYNIYQGFLQGFLLVESCRPGDANGDGMVDVDDAVYLLSYIFALGPEPPDFCCADVNGDGETNIDDVVFLVMYSFAGGPEPRRSC